jgi:aconitate hydratase
VYAAPPADRSALTVNISPTSDRIQRLTAFAPWSGQDFNNLPILIKVQGKCTTDHITPAGPWFRYRGHLDNISNNLLIGATNAENQEVNSVQNIFTGEHDGVPQTARDYKTRKQQWVIIADHNYGEGSSREHAALEPRYLNGVAVIARSFARIHETNLKKQGMLALTFANEADYDRINAKDRISLVGLTEIAPDKPVLLRVQTKEGDIWETELKHSFNEEQLGYFRAGSALNMMAAGSAQPSV